MIPRAPVQQRAGRQPSTDCSTFCLYSLPSSAQRGAYFAALGMVWAISSAIGPIMGGALAETNWRWLFYLNRASERIEAVIPCCPTVGASLTIHHLYSANLWSRHRSRPLLHESQDPAGNAQGKAEANRLDRLRCFYRRCHLSHPRLDVRR